MHLTINCRSTSVSWNIVKNRGKGQDYILAIFLSGEGCAVEIVVLESDRKGEVRQGKERSKSKNRKCVTKLP